MERVILHVDINNFYASVECYFNPELRDIPMAVTGNPKARHGIILAKNNIAKAYGVKTGETLWQAKKKCPEIVFVPSQYDRYVEFSRLAKKLCYEYTNQVESFGLDENWLDVTGSLKLFGSGEEMAQDIRHRMKNELGVTVSIGVSFNKIYAKLGSDYKKPDAVTVINKENYKNIVYDLPVGDLMFVGRKINKKFQLYNINTIGDLASRDVQWFTNTFGKNGMTLWRFANGFDETPVLDIDVSNPVKSISNGITLPYNLEKDDEVKMVFIMLAESVASRLRKSGFKARAVQIAIKDSELNVVDRQTMLPVPGCNSKMLWQTAFKLYLENKPVLHIRALSLRACELVGVDCEQISFMKDFVMEEKFNNLEMAMDNIRGKYGFESIKRAVMMTDNKLFLKDIENNHTIHPVAFKANIR